MCGITLLDDDRFSICIVHTGFQGSFILYKLILINIVRYPECFFLIIP
jgi:hypothetical protein